MEKQNVRLRGILENIFLKRAAKYASKHDIFDIYDNKWWLALGSQEACH